MTSIYMPRLWILLSLIVPWVCFSTENIPYFKQIGPTRVLTLNLNKPASKDHLTELEKALKHEKRNATTKDREQDLLFIQALIEHRRAPEESTIKAFQIYTPEQPLYEFARYYEGLETQKEGTMLLQQKPGDTQRLCDQARKIFSELMGLPSSFQSLYRSEFYNSSFCIAKSLIALKNKPQIKEFIPTLLNQWPALKGEQAEFLYKSLLEVYLEDGQIEQARATLKNAKTALLDPSWITLYEFEHPEVKSETAQPKGLSPDSALKAQKEADLISDLETLKSQKKYLEALRLVATTLERNKTAERSSLLVQRISMLSQLAFKEKIDIFMQLPDITKLPVYYQYQLARKIWEEGFSTEAAQLFYQISSQQPKAEEAAPSLFFLGRIYENQQNWQKSYETLERLNTNYPNSPFFKRAVFKMGFIAFLMNRYKDAVQWLEHARTLAQHPNDKAEASYWLYRTYQKLDGKSEAAQYESIIEQESPLSYYSFRISKYPKIESKAVEYLKENKDQKQQRIQQTRKLFSVGLLDFGTQLLSSINVEQDENLAREAIGYYNMTKKYREAIILAYNMVHLKPLATPTKVPADLLRSIFPIEFRNEVTFEAKKNKIDPELIFSLIKQESAYEHTAASPVGAIGLMQLMPATAEQVAKSQNMRSVDTLQLKTSEINIKLGTFYLKTLLNQFKGNIVHALAAYNAGPTRVDEWISYWGNLPLEYFIELIPFDETRGYVKSILRNYAFYYFLNEKTLPNKKVFESTGS